MDRPVTSAVQYHWATRYVRHRIKAHSLDFDHYPVPVKPYRFLEKKSIDDQKVPGQVFLGELFQPVKSSGDIQINHSLLSGILHHAYGVTKANFSSNIPFFKRTVPSAGGLYPCHLYLVVKGMNDLETGLYYCDMIHHRLGMIQKIPENSQKGQSAQVSFIVTADFYISAWKYRERAFRYLLLDGGHLVENVMLSLRAYGIEPNMESFLNSDSISELLSLDEDEEIPVAVISTGKPDDIFEKSGNCAKRDGQRYIGQTYKIFKEVWSSVKKGQGEIEHKPLMPQIDQEHISPESKTATTHLNSHFSSTVLARSSKRNFQKGRMTHDDAMAVICSSAELFFSNKQYQGPAESRLEIGLTTQKVEGIENGYYILRGAAGRLEKKDTGNFHQRLARICLDQTWISRSALNIIFVCDLKSLENEMGSKGYARVFMHAGRIAQRIYLAAEALGLGCCGVGALYDEEAQDLLGLDADNAVFYVVSVGLVHRSTGIP